MTDAAIHRQFADAVNDADRACAAGLITVREKWDTVLIARLIRDTALKVRNSRTA